MFEDGVCVRMHVYVCVKWMVRKGFPQGQVLSLSIIHHLWNVTYKYHLSATCTLPLKRSRFLSVKKNTDTHFGGLSLLWHLNHIFFVCKTTFRDFVVCCFVFFFFFKLFRWEIVVLEAGKEGITIDVLYLAMHWRKKKAFISDSYLKFYFITVRTLNMRSILSTKFEVFDKVLLTIGTILYTRSLEFINLA